MNNTHAFQSRLARFAALWRIGLSARSLLWGVAAGVAAFVIAGVADVWLAFDTAGLMWASRLVFGTALVAFLLTVVAVFRFTRKHAARQADRATGNSRRLITSAQDLAEESDGGGEMSGFLRGRLMDAASEKLNSVSVSRRFPWRGMRVPLVLLAAVGLLISVSFYKFPEASAVVTSRLLHPGAGLAPYSPLRFAITPDDPEVVYGSELLVGVEITGGEISHPVECLVRNPVTGLVEQTEPYRESSSRFAQKLGKITAPLEIAFRCGRARSGWKRVDVQHQPRFAAARVKITPPAYTGLPKQEMDLGAGDLVVISGSKVELEVDSNRPLSGGGLLLTPAQEGSSEVVTLSASEVHGSTARFTWTAQTSGRVSVDLIDVRGTKSEAPMQFEQRATPDEVPQVSISQPPKYVLATPDSKLPFEADTADDFGLAKVELVRALVGFRDRSHTLGDHLTTRELPVSREIDLSTLGVTPGETLEYFVEAHDRNPSLMGIGTSDVIRVVVISTEDYAARIRAMTDMSEFEERFRAITDEQRKVMDSLDELKKAIEADDKMAAKKALKKSLETHKSAKEFFEMMEKDFPAYAIDKEVKEGAQELIKRLEANAQVMEAQKQAGGMSQQQMLEAVDKMRERLGAPKKMDQAVKNAAEIAAVGKVMEMVGVFQEIRENQANVTKRLATIKDEINQGNLTNASQLKGLAKVQEANRQRLENFRRELEKRAKKLPESFSPTRESVGQFLAKLDEMQIGEAMSAAEKGAQNGDSATAYSNAMLALQMLDGLRDQQAQEGNEFAQMCKGNCPKFKIPNPNVAQTLAQILSACQSGGGEGQKPGAAGAGPGGGTGGGFSTTGPDGPNVPMVGPQRVRFQETGARGNRSRGGQSGVAEHAAISGDLDKEGSDSREPAGDQLDLKSVPENYREAVKRYFSDEEEADGSAVE